MSVVSGERSRWRHPRWTHREIAGLDVRRDARRIVQLLYEVRFASPFLVHLLFSLSFARQMAIPEMARILHGGGRGPILTAPRKRNDDTLIFFGLLIAEGDSEAGRAVGARLRAMHARFPISNDLYLYTLANLACLPEQFGSRLLGRRMFSDKENEAQHHFWKWVAEMIGATEVPEDWAAMDAWMRALEAERFAHTPEGEEIAVALGREFAKRWFPRALRGVGMRVYFASFDTPLARVLAPGRVTRAERALFEVAAGLGLRLLLWRPEGRGRTLLESFGGGYHGRPGPEQVGVGAGPQGVG
ncbi:MAG: hypothetical protein RLZZ303_150 [Candidatus Hydrogenedentota bacterium]|jgi:hypothetical protein